MHIGILANTKSGRNKAGGLADSCAELLEDHNHKTPSEEIRVTRISAQTMGEEALDFSTIDQLIVVGGDGTVHHALPRLLEHQIPFIHLATGTSNLIAKEFGMPRSAKGIVERVIASGRGGQGGVDGDGIVGLDVPTLDGTPFLIMANFGMDAGVIHRFEHSRSGSGGFRNYVIPVTKEVFGPRPADISVEVDGVKTAIQSPMNLLIANMRSYALGINPCPDADPTDGLLDVLGSPCSTTVGWSMHTNCARLRVPLGSHSRMRAKVVRVTAMRDCVVQFDGEIARTASMSDGVLREGSMIEACLDSEGRKVLAITG